LPNFQIDIKNINVPLRFVFISLTINQSATVFS